MLDNAANETDSSTMKYVATYLMLVLGGNESPSAADVTTALEAVGAAQRRENERESGGAAPARGGD